MAINPEIYGSGTTPARGDTKRMLLVKIVKAILSGGGGGGGVTGVYSGAGSPSGVITPAGTSAIYIQTDSTPPGIEWQYYGGAWH